MDLIDQPNELAAQGPKQLPHLETEEATENALVMPLGTGSCLVPSPSVRSPWLPPSHGD